VELSAVVLNISTLTVQAPDRLAQAVLLLQVSEKSACASLRKHRCSDYKA